MPQKQVSYIGLSRTQETQAKVQVLTPKKINETFDKTTVNKL
jgi:hypothetical protein